MVDSGCHERTLLAVVGMRVQGCQVDCFRLIYLQQEVPGLGGISTPTMYLLPFYPASPRPSRFPLLSPCKISEELVLVRRSQLPASGFGFPPCGCHWDSRQILPRAQVGELQDLHAIVELAWARHAAEWVRVQNKRSTWEKNLLQVQQSIDGISLPRPSGQQQMPSLPAPPPPPWQFLLRRDKNSPFTLGFIGRCKLRT